METIRSSITSALRAKFSGNEQLRNGKIREAREMYVDGLRHVLAGVDSLRTTLTESDETGPELHLVRSELEEVRVQLISNLALTELKLELWDDALAHSSMVLVADPGNQKALFRRSVARIRLSVQLDEAKSDLERLHVSDHPDVILEVTRCREAKKKMHENSFEKNFKGKLQNKSSSFSDQIHSWFLSLGVNCIGKGR